MDLKTKITGIVDNYIRKNKKEYKAFCTQQKIIRKNLTTEWAELKTGSDIVIRELNRYPESLFILFKTGLTEEENMEFRETKMQFWFGNTFPDFRVTDKKL